MNKSLKLILKEKWYRMIESGEKTEEYREIKPYWCTRLNVCPCSLSKDGPLPLSATAHVPERICDRFPGGMDKRDFVLPWETVTFYLGYATNRPSMIFEIENISVGKGKEGWCDDPTKECFVIKLGKRLDYPEGKDYEFAMEVSERMIIALLSSNDMINREEPYVRDEHINEIIDLGYELIIPVRELGRSFFTDDFIETFVDGDINDMKKILEENSCLTQAYNVLNTIFFNQYDDII